MKEELFTFLLECGMHEGSSEMCSEILVAICKETHQYNRLVGILNEIRLTENPENEQSGNST